MSLRIEALFSKRLARIKPGLARVQQADADLGWLSRRTPSILVAGTNGKGTTSSFLWRLLSLRGLRCGLFTSPHLISFAERIQVSGSPVMESDLEEAIPGLVSALDPGLWDTLSFFEASLLLALRVYRDRGTDLNILEAGLGGRLDATNIANPDAVIITSIGMDHAAFLGNTIREIAFEKSGVIRPDRPVFAGFEPRCEDDVVAMRVISAAAESRGAILHRLGRDFGVSGSSFWCGPGPVRGSTSARTELPLPAFLDGAAPYLLENFATAAAAALWWLRTRAVRTGAPLDPINSLAAWFETFSAPDGPWSPVLCGRFHPLRATVGSDGSPGGRVDHDFLFDVCHNPHGARRFVEALERAYGSGVRLPGLVSILDDKDIGGILDVLSGKLHPVVLFRITNDRGLRPDSIPAAWRHLPVAVDFDSAVSLLRSTVESRKGDKTGVARGAPWVVCGSVMAVGEVLGRINRSKSGAKGHENQRFHARTVALEQALDLCFRVRDRSGGPSAAGVATTRPV